MDNQYDLETKKKELNKRNIPNKKYTRKVYTHNEIKEILKDYIEVNRNKFPSLRPGNTRVCYIRADDNSFCYGGYINMNPIEKNDGTETLMQLRGNIRKSSKGNVLWLVAYSGIIKLWVFAGPEYEYAKQELRKSEKKQKEELSQLVDKISVHLRNLKRENRDLKKRVDRLEQQLKGEDTDNASVASAQTNFTDFSALKVYNTDTD